MNNDETLKAGVQSQKDYYRLDESLKQSRQYSKVEIQSLEHKVTIAQWMGIKSALLGWVGEVEQEMFEQLLDGYLPGTVQRIRGDRKHGRENLAVDFVLRPPKSFSMHALKDPGLYDDHMEACRQTLAATEERYCLLRKFIDGRQQNVKGDGFIAVAIPHWTSREDEMLLHTHILIINGLQGPDGKWMALDDRQLSYAEWQGVFYRRVLSKLTQQRGYPIREERLNDGGYSFEFEEVTRSQIEHFSTRSRQILEAAAAKGVSRDDVVLLTRKAKRISKTWVQFQHDCIREMEDIGVVLQTPQITVQIPSRPIYQAQASKIEEAIRHYMENTISFRREDIYRHVLNHSESTNLSEIDHAIAAHPDLVSATKLRRLTTVAAQEQEQRIIHLWNQDQSVVEPILESRQALAALKGVGLNSGQAQAIAGVLAATNRHLILNGLNNTAKGIALMQIQQLAEQHVLDMTVHTFDAESIDIEHPVLNSPVTQKNLWVIDKAGKLTPNQMESIQSRAHETGARLFLVEDPQQSYSSRAGSAMRSLELHGVHGATTFSVHRNVQAHKAIPKRALKLMGAGQGLEALSLLVEHGYLNETDKHETLSQTVAQQWLALSRAVQAKTALVAGTESERDSINGLVREGLRAEGTLGADSSFVQLISRPLNAEAMLSVANYNEGDYIRLRSEVEFVSLKQHQLYRVIGLREDQLIVSTAGGRKYRFDPAQCELEVFYTQEIQIAVGDRLRWTTTDSMRPGGSDFRVKKILGQAIVLKNAKGETQTVDGSQPLQLDHAVVFTSAALNELNRKRVIIAVSDQTAAQNLPSLLKTKEVQAYTDSLDQLKTWFAQTQNTLQIGEVNHESKRRHSAPATSSAGLIERTPREPGELERKALGRIANRVRGIQATDVGTDERPGAGRTTDTRRYEELAGRLRQAITEGAIEATLWEYKGVVRDSSRIPEQQYGDIAACQRLAGAVEKLNESITRLHRGISLGSLGIEQRPYSAIAEAIQCLREEQAIRDAITSVPLIKLNHSINRRVQDIQNHPETAGLDVAIQKLNIYIRQSAEQLRARKSNSPKYEAIAERISQTAIDKAIGATLSKGQGMVTGSNTVCESMLSDLGASERLADSVMRLHDSVSRAHRDLSNRIEQRRIVGIAEAIQNIKEDRDILQAILASSLVKLNQGIDTRVHSVKFGQEGQRIGLAIEKLNVFTSQYLEQFKARNSHPPQYEQIAERINQLALERTIEPTISKYLGISRSFDTADGLSSIEPTTKQRLIEAVEKLHDSISRIRHNISNSVEQRRISALAVCVQHLKDDRDILESIPAIVLTRLNKGHENGFPVLGIVPEVQHLDLTVGKLNTSIEQYIERFKAIKQENSDRKLYDAISARVDHVLPQISSQERDGYIWLFATFKGLGDGDRLLQHSTEIKGHSPDRIQAYISATKVFASQLSISITQEVSRSTRATRR
jgi:conjugative relaxase-like TrwC/TraI family protein